MTSKGATALTDQAVQSMVKKVESVQDERQVMLDVIRPQILAWVNRQRDNAKIAIGYSASMPEIVEIDDWQSMLVAVGNVFTVTKQLGEKYVNDGKGLLYYLWRVSFEFSSRIGKECRTELIDVFSLDKTNDGKPTISGKASASQLKKLNALAHRPICVAASIMLGDCPAKRDEILASFVTKVIKDEYTEIVKGKPVKITVDRMTTYIAEHWTDLINCKTVAEMIKVFNVEHTQTAGVKKVQSDNRKATALNNAVKKVLVDGDSFTAKPLDVQAAILAKLQKANVPTVSDRSVLTMCKALEADSQVEHIVDALALLPDLETRLKSRLKIAKKKRKQEHKRARRELKGKQDGQLSQELDKIPSLPVGELSEFEIVEGLGKNSGIASLMDASKITLQLDKAENKALVSFINGNPQANGSSDNIPGDVFVSPAIFYRLRKLAQLEGDTIAIKVK